MATMGDRAISVSATAIGIFSCLVGSANAASFRIADGEDMWRITIAICIGGTIILLIAVYYLLKNK